MTDSPILAQDIVRELLHYDPATGLFTWLLRPLARACWNTRHAGKTAGSNWSIPGTRLVYRVIRIYDWPFMAHRLAWLYMTGVWPTKDVDHKDLDGLNNRWDNLREATRVQNSHNCGAQRNNKLGVKGVCFKQGRYRATLSLNGRQLYIGSYHTIEEARSAYSNAIRLHRPIYGRLQ